LDGKEERPPIVAVACEATGAPVVQVLQLAKEE